MVGSRGGGSQGVWGSRGGESRACGSAGGVDVVKG